MPIIKSRKLFFVVLGLLTAIACPIQTVVPLTEAADTLPRMPTQLLYDQKTSTPITAKPKDDYLTTADKFFQSNINCRLPCWWGMLPGQSLWSESAKTIKKLDIFVQETTVDKLTEHALDGGILNIPASDTSILIVDKSDTIDSILVNAYNINRTNQFNVFWDSLTPEKLIDNYGRPSRIWLQSSNLSGEAGPPKEQMYVLWLFYDRLGFLVRYTGFVKNTRIFRFCLSLRSKGNLGTAIHLYLKSPNDHTLLENLAKNDIGYAEGIKLIDKISSFTTTQFSDSFMSSRNGLKCFSVSRSIWR